jgi:hypothetical protein
VVDVEARMLGLLTTLRDALVPRYALAIVLLVLVALAYRVWVNVF